MLAMCAFYEALLERDLSLIDLDRVASGRSAWPTIEADIRSKFDGALADHAVRETKVKYLAGEPLKRRLAPIVMGWEGVSRRLRDQLVTTATLAGMLRRAGALSRPEDIGLNAEGVRSTFPRAMYYHSRYTALDVAWELGIFDDVVEDAFSRWD